MSLQSTHISQPVPLDPPHGEHPSLALLDGLPGVEGDRVLVLGHGAVELVCALIRKGCPEVTELHCNDRPTPAIADLVLVPRVTSVEQATLVIAHARRALLGGGRVSLCVPGHLVSAVAHTLPSGGFRGISRRDSAAGCVLTAYTRIGRA